MIARGRVREAWPLNSDNAGLEDPAREQVRQWRLAVAKDKSGQSVQVNGPISFAFETTIGDPLPQLTDAEVRALATKIVEPQWPAGTLPSGTAVDVQVSVDQQGKLAGTHFSTLPPSAFAPVYQAIHGWTFRPLLRNGKPQYFQGTVHFVVP